ncbi:MAG TPA: GNAT family N-acetyltransferase [Candidatus Syntrophosphaera sp.]|nr:GNAT family N-acetyltransferase [Candidatus Syntrophosphaera thermopropionivorans]HRQ99070.1 GNAT family N-acetyltransferase [Candidatus Syntrophosphaera sp.]HOH81875.1 GNAT family N-acetyltransferase [Candidatus Syntrophosphaera thermopropionivorans]HOJ41554.1 GNAT family N-acetyltransferase [Candidatus Syntrophosphaera thermopropionivorans]HOL33202.1 GNAT family N-acetyltransferase [Candidatus Syntrophosphaera thermopropionivorans]
MNENLYAEIISIWDKTGISNPERADSFDSIQRTLEHGGILLLAYMDAILVGTIWLTNDYRRLYLHHMAVLPEFQKQGIGRSLLQEAIQIADKQGLQAKLEVHSDNAAALNLYRSMGFKVLDGYLVMIRRN